MHCPSNLPINENLKLTAMLAFLSVPLIQLPSRCYLLCVFFSWCPMVNGIMLADTQFRFVKSALWHSGYGAWWVVGPWACENGEIGSRDLLLAFSWLIASGNLLEALLQERLLHLDILSSAAGVSLWNLVKCTYTMCI